MDDFEKILNSIYEENNSESVTETSINSEDCVHYDSSGVSPTPSSSSQPLSDEEVFATYYSRKKPQKVIDTEENSSNIDSDLQSSVKQDYSEEDSEHNIPDGTDADIDIDLSEIEDNEIDDDFGPKSFKDFVTSRIAGLIIKIRGGVPADATTYTGEEDTDELGKEVSVKVGYKYYGSQSSSINLRLLISLGALFFLTYVSLGLPIVGSLNNIKVAAAFCLVAELSIVVFSLDVFTNGILNIFCGRFGANSLASLSCIISALDACMVLTETGTAHMPFCILSCMSLLGILWSSYLSARGIRKTLRVPSISKRIYTVTGETGITGKEITLLKSFRNISGFVRRVEEEPPDECIYRKIAPIILILSIVGSVLISYFKHSVINFFYIFTALFCSSVPIATLLPYSLSFIRGAFHIFPSGAAIAGWSGLSDIGHSKNLIVTDRDLFPSGTIEIQNVRIFANYDSDKVMSYAASIIRESECGLYEAFTKLLYENNLKDMAVENFECLAGGGFKGMIEGHTIVCGSVDLMRLMNVKIPSRLVDDCSVLLSIDNLLYGIFNVSYKPDAKVRRALVSLMNSNRHAIFAIRDFNVTPDLIRDCFDVATDGYDFPPYIDRFPLSQARPSSDSKIAGVVCREGLGPLIVLADTGRSLFVVIRICTIISVVSAFAGLIGVALAFIVLNKVNIVVVFLYFIAVLIPILFLGLFGYSFN